MRSSTFVATIGVLASALLGQADCDGGTIPLPTPPDQPGTSDYPITSWTDGGLSALPNSSELLPLPGGGEGPGVFTSNNPELFTGTGTLYQIAREDAARGGESYPLNGRHRAYIHHLNRSGQGLYLHLLITNPNEGFPIDVNCEGSGYNQTDTGGIGEGFSPDYSVAEDWLTGDFNYESPVYTVEPFGGISVWVKSIPNGQEVDALLECVTNGPAFYYLVATNSTSTSSALNASTRNAPGTIAPPGTPPPPYGREAGVYAHDTWRGAADIDVPAPGKRLGFMLNTATGGGLPQIQAFPALTHFDDSSTEAVGMYGNHYKMNFALYHGGEAPGPVTVDVYMAAYGGGSPSSYWNGPVDMNGNIVPVWLTPSERLQRIGTVTVAPGAPAEAQLWLPVPGLSAIPQAIWLETR